MRPSCRFFLILGCLFSSAFVGAKPFISIVEKPYFTPSKGLILPLSLLVDKSQPNLILEYSGEKSVTQWKVASSKKYVSLSLQFSAQKRQGIFKVTFAFENKPINYIIPSNMGEIISAKVADIELNWPYAWEAALLIIEFENGGIVSIWSKDSKYPFKKLTINKAAGSEVSIEVFAPTAQALSSSWVVRSYRSWNEAVDEFRQEVLDVHPVIGAAQAHSVNTVVNVRLDGDYLREKQAIQNLAKQLNAAKTLLYMPLWRIKKYDQGYPDYTPKPYLKNLIHEAHQLGFRVMVHINEDFIALDSEKKSEFWEYRQIKIGIPYCYKTLFYNLKNHSERKSFRVKRNTEKWINLMIGKIKEIHDDLLIDGVHFDVSRSIPPGCDDSMIAGTKKLHGAVREHFPNLILSGEYISEVSRSGLDFYQGLPIDLNKNIPNKRGGMGQFHPVSLRLFSPARVYTHLHASSVNEDGLVFSLFRSSLPEAYQGLIMNSKTIYPKALQ